MGRYYRELKTNHIRLEDVQMAELNNEMIYPMIGLGTGGLSGPAQNYQVIKEALKDHNYAAIDSASMYESESTIGTLLREDKTLRSGLFLTSKIWPTDLYFQATLTTVQKTLLLMKTNYIDLYMIHWPMCYDDLEFMDCTNSKDGKWQQSYDALSKLYGEGIILNIGVSNWDEELMTELLQDFPTKPQIVQNHVDLTNIDWDFKDFLDEYEIVLQAYSTFRGFAEAKEEEYKEWTNILQDICDEIKEDQEVIVSPSQLVLRFMVENDLAIIPRSTKSQHLKENNDLFSFEFNNDYNVRLGGRDVDKEEL